MKPNAKLKNTLLIGGTILLLVLGGFGVWQSRPSATGASDPSQTTPNADKTTPAKQLKLINTFIGHTNWIRSLAISPDGNTIVSGGWDKTIKIWNLKAHKSEISTPVRTLTGHTDWVRSLGISPDGQMLISGSKKEINVWNLRTGELKYILTGHTDWVNSLAISADEQTLVSGSSDGTIKIWNLTTGELKNNLTWDKGILSIAITPDGQTIVSSSLDNKINIWNLKTGKLKNTLTEHSNWVFSLAISADSKTLVSGSQDKSIKVWPLGKMTTETETLPIASTLTLADHSHGVVAVAISPDGETLVSASDQEIKIWNLKTGQQKDSFKGNFDRIISLAITPDEQILVSQVENKNVKVMKITKN